MSKLPTGKKNGNSYKKETIQSYNKPIKQVKMPPRKKVQAKMASPESDSDSETEQKIITSSDDEEEVEVVKVVNSDSESESEQKNNDSDSDSDSESEEEKDSPKQPTPKPKKKKETKPKEKKEKEKEEGAKRHVMTPIERLDLIIQKVEEAGNSKEVINQLSKLRKQLDGAKIKQATTKRPPNAYNLWMQTKMAELKGNNMNPKERFSECIRLWNENKANK